MKKIGNNEREAHFVPYTKIKKHFKLVYNIFENHHDVIEKNGQYFKIDLKWQYSRQGKNIAKPSTLIVSIEIYILSLHCSIILTIAVVSGNNVDNQEMLIAG